MKYKCKKCQDTGWYAYDHNHHAKCDDCCKHDKGWWMLEQYYGNDNGRFCCMNGCGTTKKSPFKKVK